MRNLFAIRWRRATAALALAGFVWLAAAMCAPSAQAQTYTVLYRFKGGTADGENPEAGLVLDSSGNLYGTTVFGTGCLPTACAPLPGMVFKVTSTGETIMHNFTGAPTACGTTGNPACDGASPYGGVLLDPTNNAYGTTNTGGASNLGTVFKISTTGEKVLHSFTGSPSDGAFPYAGVVEDSAGNIYGTTSAGGASNKGAVFKIEPSGTETLLYSFKGGEDGASPYGGLLRNAAGDLFGTASAGGIATGNCFPSGCGVVFLVTSTGTEHILYRFAGSPDAASPFAGLIVDSSDNVYGTTYNGGTGACTNGCGTIFEIDKAGKETVLYSFQGYPNDGAFPLGGVVRDSTGDLYGTTTYGGASDSGAVFELPAAGPEKLLYSFTGETDGAIPRSGLIMDSSGNLYGTTYGGGVSGPSCGGEPADSCGVVFKLKP
jgi:uncharacterized repeat protein (TIGR03803 family)